MAGADHPRQDRTWFPSNQPAVYIATLIPRQLVKAASHINFKMAAMTTSSAGSVPFSASTSFHVPPMSPQPNLVTQLPSVDFNFDDLRLRMSAFSVKFDAFIERGRKRVLEERNEFGERLGELAGVLASGFFFLARLPFPMLVVSSG